LCEVRAFSIKTASIENQEHADVVRSLETSFTLGPESLTDKGNEEERRADDD
jgi:hypothetical protein